jgi:hypothetical protein
LLQSPCLWPEVPHLPVADAVVLPRKRIQNRNVNKVQTAKHAKQKPLKSHPAAVVPNPKHKPGFSKIGHPEDGNEGNKQPYPQG